MTPPRPGQDGWSISRLRLWIAVLALPLAALALLLAEPELDMRWEHHPSHFWLVLTVAGVNVVLGLVASEAAARRDDDRTFLVSMALLTSAGFYRPPHPPARSWSGP
jgi:adenylate cyclase